MTNVHQLIRQLVVELEQTPHAELATRIKAAYEDHFYPSLDRFSIDQLKEKVFAKYEIDSLESLKELLGDIVDEFDLDLRSKKGWKFLLVCANSINLEDITETGIGDFIASFNYAFHEMGLQEPVIEEESFEDYSYSVKVNGKRYIFYTKDDLAKDDLWKIVAREVTHVFADLLQNTDRFLVTVGEECEFAVIASRRDHAHAFRSVQETLARRQARRKTA